MHHHSHAPKPCITNNFPSPPDKSASNNTHLCQQVAGWQGHVTECCLRSNENAPCLPPPPCLQQTSKLTPTHAPTSFLPTHAPVRAGGRAAGPCPSVLLGSMRWGCGACLYSHTLHPPSNHNHTSTPTCASRWQGHVPQGCWVPHVLLSTQTRTQDKALYTHAPVRAGGRVAGPCPSRLLGSTRFALYPNTHT
jgi:hypothetical protein